MGTPHEDHSSSSRKEKLKSAVKKIGLSVGKKVAKTGIVRKAIEKASSYPLVLTVVVNRLDGVLAINIPPPTTDIVWWVHLHNFFPTVECFPTRCVDESV